MTGLSRLCGLSRRTILVRSAACAAGATALLATVKQAAAKMSHASVAYQDSPKGDQQCEQLLAVPGAGRVHTGRWQN